MAKQKSRKSRTSKGLHGSSASVNMSQGMDRLLNQQKAFAQGKNVVLTVATKQSNQAFIRRNAKDVWLDKRKLEEKNAVSSKV